MEHELGTEKTPEVQKMTGNGGDHVLCTTVYVEIIDYDKV